MYAPVTSTLSHAFSPSAASVSMAPRREPFPRPRTPDPYVSLIRHHHRAIFHLAHALLRDEVAAEQITQQVFARARRRLDQDQASVIEWIYYASFRFVRMYHWRSIGPIARRRMRRNVVGDQPELDLKMLVHVIARHPGKLDPHDCELLALRHVLGMPLINIAQLLRMHPYEVSNRLAWALERVYKFSHQVHVTAEKNAELALSA